MTQTLATLVSGRTMIPDAATHDIFVPAAMTTPNPAGKGRPVPVAGTFQGADVRTVSLAAGSKRLGSACHPVVARSVRTQRGWPRSAKD